MLRSESLMAMRLSAALAAADQGGLLDPNGFVVESASLLTSFGAGLLNDAAGLVGTPQLFAMSVPDTLQGLFPVLVRVPWTLAAAAGGGAAFGTIQAELIIDGVVVATSQGAPRDLTVVPTDFVEIIELIPTTSNTIPPGGTLAVQLTPIVTTPSGAGGSTYEPRLRHDPQTTADQLVVEIQAAELAQLSS